MDGVLNIRKPIGPTSHDVVDKVRRIVGLRRVGHAGTLDPIASGVLVVCVGRAARIVEYIVGCSKEYRARVVLGASTDTDDASGQIVKERGADAVAHEDFERACAAFVGEIDQAAPLVSALKQDGERMYKLVRQGKPVQRKVRRVVISSIDVSGFTPGVRAEGEIVVNCGSGVYIRSLCADIGRQLGCGAFMGALERTRVGHFLLENSVALEELAEIAQNGLLAERMISCADALAHMPTALVDERGADDLRHGRLASVHSDSPPDTDVRVLTDSGDLLAVGQIIRHNGKTQVKPRKVLSGAQD